MEGRCEKHSFERMEAYCRSCGGEFCGDCLVYAHGPRKPPYCVSCALAAAGVRSSAARAQVRSKREIRREERAQRRAERASAKARSNVSAEALFEAEPIGVTPSDLGPPELELEMTINDDGTVDRPARRSMFDQAPVEEPAG